MAILTIENDGPRIAATNYWTLPRVPGESFRVSLNAGAFRLLLRPGMEPAVLEMATARHVVVSRGPWPKARRADAFEFLFDDGSDSPFALHTQPEAFDRLPAAEDFGKLLVLSAWLTGPHGDPVMALERPCHYRRAPQLPWLKPLR